MQNKSKIRQRATENLELGPVTASYTADRQQIIRLLNEALATEIVCVLRYKNHYYSAEGLVAEPIAQEFREHAREEEEHVDLIAKRIHELGGNANFNPEDLLSRAHSEYREGDSVVEMIRENLIAERIAIDAYREIIKFIGDQDPTSRRIMEKILAKEEEHAEDMVSRLKDVDQALDAKPEPRAA